MILCFYVFWEGSASEERRQADLGIKAPPEPRQAHSERLWRTCTHAPTKLGSGSRGHGRPTCTQEAHPQPISARARPLRHDDCEVAADVAVGRDGCTCCCSARRRLLVADGLVHGRGPPRCTNPVAESRRGRTAAWEVHPTSVTKTSAPRSTFAQTSWTPQFHVCARKRLGCTGGPLTRDPCAL